MTDLQQQLEQAKARFSTATTEALSGDDSAWTRAGIYCRQVQKLLAQIKAHRPAELPATAAGSPPAPAGSWAIAAQIKREMAGQ